MPKDYRPINIYNIPELIKQRDEDIRKEKNGKNNPNLIGYLEGVRDTLQSILNVGLSKDEIFIEEFNS